MSITLTILGCGNSEGTPSIGNDWGKCDPDEPRNRRMRPCAAVQSDATTLIIDTGPDFKNQINKFNINKIDGVLYTHSHGDHINGIDELRVWAKLHKALVPVYGLGETIEEISQRFDYHFIEKNPLYPSVLNAHVIADMGKPMTIGDITFTPFMQDHGTCKSLGMRFGDVAYSTDLVRLDDAAIETLRGVKTWIVDGAGFQWPENPAHLSLEGVYALNERIGAEKCYITHLTRGMDYRALLDMMPNGYEPAYDGLQIPIKA